MQAPQSARATEALPGQRQTSKTGICPSWPSRPDIQCGRRIALARTGASRLRAADKQPGLHRVHQGVTYEVLVGGGLPGLQVVHQRYLLLLGLRHLREQRGRRVALLTWQAPTQLREQYRKRGGAHLSSRALRPAGLVSLPCCCAVDNTCPLCSMPLAWLRTRHMQVCGRCSQPADSVQLRPGDAGTLQVPGYVVCLCLLPATTPHARLHVQTRQQLAHFRRMVTTHASRQRMPLLQLDTSRACCAWHAHRRSSASSPCRPPPSSAACRSTSQTTQPRPPSPLAARHSA